MGEQIKVVVEKNGKLSIEVQGVSGARCLSLTEFLEKEVGEVSERERTREYFQKGKIALMERLKQKNPFMPSE